MRRTIRHFVGTFLACGPIFAAEIIPAPQPTAAAGSPAKQAVDAYRDGRRAAAVEMARPLAESGNPDALFLMGFSLESLREPSRLSRGQAMDYYYRKAEAAGHPEAALRRQLIVLSSGKSKERDAGVAQLEAAAKAGDPRAPRILGEASLRGILEGKPDAAKAAQYWKSAADAGDGASFVLLGQLHDGVFGFPEMKDTKVAIGFLRKAAELGREDAFIPLASLLLLGGEGPPDEQEGEKWIGKALEAGNNLAWLVMGDYRARVKRDSRGSLESFRKGAEAGQHDCMLRLARTPADPESGAAVDWVGRAAEAGDPEAAAEIGHRMLAGDSAEATAAVRYLLLAASEKLPQAQYDLGIAYLEGKGCARDPLASMTWLTEAMKSGDAESQYKLATLHEQGIGGPVNYANAGVLYTLAFGKGHAGAAARIAYLAAEGLGTGRNPTQAWAYASLAMERGDNSVKELRAALEDELDEAGKTAAKKILADLRSNPGNPPTPAAKK